MPRLTDIKYRIDQLDGGTFQNLCDAYLSCLGYKNVCSLGMKAGTSKTTIGNPDTYFLNADEKYIFVMYTTQKTDFLRKAMFDISKCFDFSATGVAANEVVEIVFCHTYERLSPGEDKALRDVCNKNGASLVLKGLDEIATDIFLRHHIIAKDFLDISLDSGQILTKEEFVKSNDANSMSAPLNTAFQFRENEKGAILAGLQTHDVVLLSGPAGIGKTRLALEACNVYAAENNIELRCIRSKYLEIYEDIKNLFSTPENYVFLVDDANELSGLHHILTFLNENKQKQLLKIVITVRNYARSTVSQSILGFAKYELVKVPVFTDEEICKLMGEHYGITNRLYTDRIVAISEGNARLAMLAGKVASETETLASISDASELCDSYYRKQIDSIPDGSQSEMISAGIVAFLQAIHLHNKEHLRPS